MTRKLTCPICSGTDFGPIFEGSETICTTCRSTVDPCDMDNWVEQPSVARPLVGHAT